MKREFCHRLEARCSSRRNRASPSREIALLARGFHDAIGDSSLWEMLVRPQSLWVSLVVVYLSALLLYRLYFVSSVSRFFRQRRVINNVDKYSELLPYEKIRDDPELEAFVNTLKLLSGAPYVVFFDQSNFDVTMNHVCNLELMPGALERFAAVAFEPEAERRFRAVHPSIPVVTVDFTVIKDAIDPELENRKYVIYQLILLTRARIAAAFASKDLSFWAMQQDSIWVENFAVMDIENRFTAPLIFDVIGNDRIPEYKRMDGWICGSTFFARGGALAENFFLKLDALMRSRQSPDSAIMSYLCGHAHYQCQTMPRWIVSSSNYFRGPRDLVPIMIQVDHQSKMSKMDLFKKERFAVLRKDGSCDAGAVARLRDAARVALLEIQTKDLRDHETFSEAVYYEIRRFLNIDPYNRKKFLTVHESLV
ncbi:unnamed protein product [Caenorhabditis auriculariae]|uniref:Nucleotide-diphospho-sugar transferase domain-containing protein n=1 Tax=Caenorhabditis auriculariae TaxID=2777116 RepID=A0A8S1GNS9_9PELO|nr:unnamed protein product [Caenorhabditis auriculariae]